MKCNRIHNAIVGGLVVLFVGTVLNAAIVLDFETEDDFTTPLVNGQDISTPPEFGNLVFISSTGNNLGVAIFDSDPNGPNAGGGNPDLLVNLGNILILQNINDPNQTVGGIFDVPNGSFDGGEIIFNFVSPVTLLSIDLINVGEGTTIDLELEDANGIHRVYGVPQQWTNNLSAAPLGWATLDLTTLTDQAGETGALAGISQDAGFDPTSVVKLEVDMVGPAGIDNLQFIPEPTTLALVAAGAIGLLRRKRR